MQKKLYPYMNWPMIESIVYSEEDQPHTVLGKSVCKAGTIFQTFQPNALKVWVIFGPKNTKLEMVKIDEMGFFAAITEQKKVKEYEYVVEKRDGSKEVILDPYQFEEVIKKSDIEKFEKGEHYEIYRILGAHEQIQEGIQGILFAVWAPNAKRVSVVGDFNDWDGRVHQMRRIYSSGVFELFIPHLQTNCVYKYEIKLKNTLTYLKADPYTTKTEMPPNSASIVDTDEKFSWTDQKWISERKNYDIKKMPVSIMEINFLYLQKEFSKKSFLKVAEEVVHYALKMQYTHIECEPFLEFVNEDEICEQTSQFYAVSRRYGGSYYFKYFVNLCHEHGLGVVADWNCSSFPKDLYGLNGFDGTALYGHENEKLGENFRNGTKNFNYGRNEVRNFLLANALYLIHEFHFDGLKLCHVGEMLYLDYGKSDNQWLPNIYGGNENLEAIRFLQDLNNLVHKEVKGVFTIADDSTKWMNTTGSLNDGGLGFDLKWNYGWTYDMLGFFEKDPKYRSKVYNEFMFSTIYACAENYQLFLSHKEAHHTKDGLLNRMYGDVKQKESNLRGLISYMYIHPGKKLMYQYSLGEDNALINQMLLELNTIYRTEPALYDNDKNEHGFEWIDSVDTDSCVYTFVRKGKGQDSWIFCVCNFSSREYKAKLIGVPYMGKYKEFFNSSMVKYGGEKEKLSRKRTSNKVAKDGMTQSIKLDLLPGSVSLLKLERIAPRKK